MKVVALQTWANSSISMEEKQVADIPDDLAAYLIERGIVAESPEYYGGGSGGGVLVVTDTDGTLDKTWTEIHDAMLSGGAVISRDEKLLAVTSTYIGKGTYYLDSGGNIEYKSYSTDSASGYPSDGSM